MIFTVGELIEVLENRGDDDSRVFVSHDPQGGPAAARPLEVETEYWPDPETMALVATVVIYPA